MNYPLFPRNIKGTLLWPTHSSYSDEYAQRTCNLYLSDEVHKEADGKIRKYFRLHAKNPHSIEDALAYDIFCPDCGCRTHLKQVGRTLNYNDLGLYKCPICQKD